MVKQRVTDPLLHLACKNKPVVVLSCHFVMCRNVYVEIICALAVITRIDAICITISHSHSLGPPLPASIRNSLSVHTTQTIALYDRLRRPHRPWCCSGLCGEMGLPMSSSGAGPVPAGRGAVEPGVPDRSKVPCLETAGLNGSDAA